MSKNNYNAKQLKNVTTLNPSTIIYNSGSNSNSDATLESVVITSGTLNNITIGNLFPGPAVFTNATLGNLTVDASSVSTNNSTPISFSTPILVQSVIQQSERINMTDTFIQPSNTFNLSMISITEPNQDISGFLITPSYDFFEKTIVVESLAANSFYTLNFPENTLCTSEGCRSAQSVLFSCPGQGITFIYSMNSNSWYIKNSGATVNYL